MMLFRAKALLFALAIAALHTSSIVAYAPASRSPKSTATKKITTQSRVANSLASFAAAAALFVLPIISPDPALADSKTAAQIQLNSVPPSTVEIQIGDLPVIGNLISGTYARIDTDAAKAVGKALGEESKASVTIRSPSDKLAAIKDLATKGHLEFDVNGLLNTHMDVDVATPKPGELMIDVESPLIPPLPFKNKITAPAGGTAVGKTDGKPSDWAVVTNLGDGTTFYTNVKTGESQFEKPTKI